MLANRVREYTATTGTGDVTLGGALPAHITFDDAFDVGDAVTYVIEDGDNYEIGTGTLVSADTLSRTTVGETLVDGTYVKTGAAAINLSGNARVFCAATADFLLDPTEAADVITEVTPGAGVTVDGVTLRDGAVLIDGTTAIDANRNAFLNGVAAEGMVSITDTTPTLKFIDTDSANATHQLSSVAGVLSLDVDLNNVAGGSAFKLRFDGNDRVDIDGSGNINTTGAINTNTSLAVDTGAQLANPGLFFRHANFAGSSSNFITVNRDTEDMGFFVNDQFVLQLRANRNADFYGDANFAGDVSVGAAHIDQPFEVHGTGSRRFYVRDDGVVAWNPQAQGGELTWDTNKAIIKANANADYLILRGGGVTENLTLDDLGNTTAGGDVNVAGNVTLTDNSKVLSGNILNFRYIRRPTNTGDLSISAGDDFNRGANLLMYGGEHPTLANDFYIRANGSTLLAWDNSAGYWNFQNNDITTTGSITMSQLHGDSDTGALDIYGGTGTSGANILLYAGSHATQANDILLRTGGTTRLAWDNSGGYWDFSNHSAYGLNNIRTADGTAATPSHSFTSDTDTGVYLASANTLGFVTGGTTQWIVSNTGDLVANSATLIRKNSNTSSLTITGGITGAQGSAITVYGTTGTFAGDIDFASSGNSKLIYDASADHWDYRSNDIIGVNNLTIAGNAFFKNTAIKDFGIEGTSTTGTVLYGGGTNAGSFGANIQMYAESHASAANDMSLRGGSTAWLYWDNSLRVASLTGDLAVGGMLNLGTPTELTISSGVITVTKSFHTVDTEGDAATDDLVTINGGSHGDILILSIATGFRIPTIKHGTGNIRLKDGVDFVPTSVDDTIELIFLGTRWCELSRSINT